MELISSNTQTQALFGGGVNLGDMERWLTGKAKGRRVELISVDSKCVFVGSDFEIEELRLSARKAVGEV
jgi:hypothetical protein